MIVGLDTDVLVNWAVSCAPHHEVSREFVYRQVEGGLLLGVAPQVLREFAHITTDPFRFEHPLTDDQAYELTQEIWNAPEVVQIPLEPSSIQRTFELMITLELDRRKLHETSLAATLEQADIHRLATFHGRDFDPFPFLDIVDPTL